MKHGKFSTPRVKRSVKRPVALLVSLVLLFALGIGATVAFILDQTGSVKNTFQPGYVTPDIHEDFENNVKSNVYIENDGNVSAYIRVALVPTWEDDNGNPVGVSASLDDLNFTGLPGTGWVKGSDGYYYYTSPVAAGKSTDTKLFTEVVVDTESAGYNNGYHMNLQILAQAIQAEGVNSEGKTPVELAWGAAAAGIVGAIEQGG